LSRTVDYYFAPNSPWAYLGHERLAHIAQATGASINVLPMDLGGKVFPVSGGVPLGQRAPQRQAYRLVELARYSQHLNAPLNLKPRFFPVDPGDAARLIVAVKLHDGEAAAMRISGAALRAVWAQERNIADEHVLAALLDECKLPPERLAQSHSQAVAEAYDAYTQRAIEVGVFGAPSYVVDGEIFWGQDRLDFVERKLSHKA
jgi:2-hydroxychromene-2-carboxylate isomerase